jgi:hypothetical protein
MLAGADLQASALTRVDGGGILQPGAFKPMVFAVVFRQKVHRLR